MSRKPNKIGAANSAPRMQFHGFEFSIDLVAGGAALTGAVADLWRSAQGFIRHLVAS